MYHNPDGIRHKHGYEATNEAEKPEAGKTTGDDPKPQSKAK